MAQGDVQPSPMSSFPIERSQQHSTHCLPLQGATGEAMSGGASTPKRPIPEMQVSRRKRAILRLPERQSRLFRIHSSRSQPGGRT